ncbi:MAG TPA: D-alanyl-D-alanine carboxypeptidase/D-alanyl-D-alanine-endopeptidase [Candidatus Acidoferrum sp.]|jgi:D-alanyl-D-alanine carboxypeptidase/D-alanyl-D-alanine-endopeptidase (penicillin-binding protein 4)|nr:D-alanyl-D-alanine carboxypeptidase/D-alanyl-D-alanine-endopeptidase [Candidatus Acidoferrum sp.]
MTGPLRALAAALAFAAVSACGHRPEQRVEVASAAALHPPSIAATHVPPPWSAADVRALQAQLREAFGGAELANSGIAVVDAAGRPLFVRRERTPMTPASTFKLLVSASAYRILGPRFRFTTTLEAQDDPSDGTIHGDVYLVGSGDPTLTRDDLRAGIGALYQAGIRKITGSIVADASAFSGPEVNRFWDPDDLQYDYAAGTSALSLDQGTVEFDVIPTTPGAPARIVANPSSDAVRWTGSVMTSYTTMLTIQRAPEKNDFTFDGRIAAGAQQAFWRPVIGMPLYAAGVARMMLRQRGIEVDGGIRTGLAPLTPAVLWRHRSAPLSEIVKQMLLVSNNHFAEQLLRAVGATTGAGTEASGGRVERAVLKQTEVPDEGLRIVDGSGLAPVDRVAPLTLALLLAHTAAESTGTQFVRELPRAGIEGTVKYHQLTDGLGRVRAKSGHIEGVNALAGYVDTRRHGRVSFVIIVNGPNADGGGVYDGMDKALDDIARS